MALSKRHLHSLILSLTLLSQTLTAATFQNPNVISINGTDQFNSLISKPSHTFIKLYDPNCPHCVALAPHFITLAKTITTLNNQPNLPPSDHITLAEVDNSLPTNRLIIRNHALGFPTLKLFFSGRLVSEYEGPRLPTPMLEYLKSAIYFRSADLITKITSPHQLNQFLSRAALRPVVISLFHDNFLPSLHYPPHISICPKCWHSAIVHMRNISAPNVAFATVISPHWLLPKTDRDLARFWRTRRMPFVPALAAAPSGKTFWKRAAWWYPGLHNDDSMEAFMHANCIPENNYVVVNRFNAPHLLTSVRPLAIAFGNEAAPSWSDEIFLMEAARFDIQPRFVPLYVKTKEFEEFAEHVGVVGERALNDTGGDSSYVVYRAAATRPAVTRFLRSSRKASEFGDPPEGLSEWLGKMAEQVNRSNVAIYPGKVLELDRGLWEHVFEYDGRGVLLELYRVDCAACRRFSKTFQQVARMLEPHAGGIVVARFDISKGFVPEVPKLPRYKYVPAIVYVPPGQEGILYEGWNAPKGIAKFARGYAELDDVPLASLGVLEVAGAVLFQIGLMFLVIGLLMRRWGRKRDHIK